MTGSPAATRDQVPASDEAQESREDATGPGVASRVLSNSGREGGATTCRRRPAAETGRREGRPLQGTACPSRSPRASVSADQQGAQR